MTRRRTTAASRHRQRCSFSPFIHFSHSSPVVSSKVTQSQYIPGSHKWCHPDSTSPSVLPITGLAGDMQAKPRAALSRYSLCVTRHTSHVTRHTSHVIRHSPCAGHLVNSDALPTRGARPPHCHTSKSWICIVPSPASCPRFICEQQQQLSQGDGDKLHQVSNQRLL
jgi:hypothetical protein